MTRYTQTHNMTASGHLSTLTHYLGKTPDTVIINTGPIPLKIKSIYSKYHEFKVVDDLTGPYQIIRGDFVSKSAHQAKKGDTVARSLLRHDQHKLTQAIIKLL